jgi:hypothetical protein
VSSHRNWFIHEHPNWVQLSGLEIKTQLGEGDEIDMDVMTAIWRAIRMLETKMYRGSRLRWRHIFEPQLAVSSKEKPTTDVFQTVKIQVLMKKHYAISPGRTNVNG